VGKIQLLAFPLTSLTDPPFNPDSALSGLQEWSEDIYRGAREHRELTFGESYVFEQDEPEPADAGNWCAVRYAFKGTLNGTVQDRVMAYATYDSVNLYQFVASYDAANASEGVGFVDAESLEEFAPFLGELVAALALPP
jgi:hypothetical protein